MFDCCFLLSAAADEDYVTERHFLCPQPPFLLFHLKRIKCLIARSTPSIRLPPPSPPTTPFRSTIRVHVTCRRRRRPVIRPPDDNAFVFYSSCWSAGTCPAWRRRPASSSYNSSRVCATPPPYTCASKSFGTRRTTSTAAPLARRRSSTMSTITRDCRPCAFRSPSGGS